MPAYHTWNQKLQAIKFRLNYKKKNELEFLKTAKGNHKKVK